MDSYPHAHNTVDQTEYCCKNYREPFTLFTLLAFCCCRYFMNKNNNNNIGHPSRRKGDTEIRGG